MHATLPLMRQYRFPGLSRSRLETLQVNLGYKCNQSCVHCHVNAGPSRTEMMQPQTISEVLQFVSEARPKALDITGGAPELHPQFRSLVVQARELGKHVIDRCNLTVLQEPGQEGLAAFLAAQGVEVVDWPEEERKKFRQIAQEKGVAFDEMAVCLRTPQQYLGLLEHAFGRAGVPAYFDRGARRPDPAGRAFAALVNNPTMPIQFVFAGKSHPADDIGKHHLQRVFTRALDPMFAGRVAFADLRGTQTAWTGDRAEFLGRHGTLEHPAALEVAEVAGWRRVSPVLAAIPIGVPSGSQLRFGRSLAAGTAFRPGDMLEVRAERAGGNDARIYLPQDEMVAFGVTERHVQDRTCDAAWQCLMRFQVDRARTLMLSGSELGKTLPGRVGLEIRATIQGGLRILEKIERARYDVFRRRPKLRAYDWPLLLAKAL